MRPWWLLLWGAAGVLFVTSGRAGAILDALTSRDIAPPPSGPAPTPASTPSPAPSPCPPGQHAVTTDGYTFCVTD